MCDAVSAVTRSLFPPHVISVTPLPHVDATCTRIMAGYLLLCEASECVSLLYCELRSYSHGEASLAAYRDEFCEVEVAALQITENSVMRTCNGVHCNIFGLGRLRFCARTNEETELWIRALMNVKTKLMCDAPDPSADDLAVFREAVLQRVGELPDVPKKACDLQTEAMLPLRPRQPVPARLMGDIWSPPLQSTRSLSNESDPRCQEWLEGIALKEQSPEPKVNSSMIDCQVLSLERAAISSLPGVADEFREGDVRPCAKLSPTPCLFDLP